MVNKAIRNIENEIEAACTDDEMLTSHLDSYTINEDVVLTADDRKWENMQRNRRTVKFDNTTFLKKH